VRILYFTRDYTPHDHRFLSALAQTEHEVYYLRLERGAHQLEDRALPPEVKIVSWGGGRSPARLRDALRLLRSLRDVLRNVQPDVLHAGPIQTVGLLAALSGFQPIVAMSWGSDLLRDAERNNMYRWVTRFVLKHSSVLVGDCSAVRQKSKDFGVPDDRIVTFPWGVDLQQFSPGEEGSLRARAGWEDAFVLLHTRSWEPIYGVDILVRAFIAAAQENPDLRTFLLGGGSLAGKVHAMFERAGMLDRVSFSGQVSHKDLPGYYRAADLYVSASHSDGSSVSLMEALASGLPALVSDIPGNREWVVPGEHGWWFPDGDADALAQGILQAVDQRERLSVIGRAARNLAEQRANWNENFQHLLKAYEMALAK
jgi:glycosyltransferase involved in cell wall biosynthesis